MQIEGSDHFRTLKREKSLALLLYRQAWRQRRAVGRNGRGKGPPAPKRTCFAPRRVESAGRWSETGAE